MRIPRVVTVVSTIILAAVLPATSASAAVLPVVVSARFAESGPTVTYRPDAVPVGARATVLSVPVARTTTVVLVVRGLTPHQHYGAHVHTRPCGPAPTDAGPHYQNVVDPIQPSTDPAYANPSNEVWLDLTTDARGAAIVNSTVDWTFRGAGALVIHEHHTHTAPGEAGTAGARLACVTVPF